MSKWNLKAIFESQTEYYETIDACLRSVEKLCSYQGKLNENVNEFFPIYDDLYASLEDIECYGAMKYHLDMSDNDKIQDFMKAQNVESIVKEKLAWIVPELITYDMEVIINSFSDINKQKYQHTIEKIFLNKDYTLSAGEEKIIVSLEKAREDIVNSYQALTTSDRLSVKVEISSGVIEVNNGNYSKLLSELEHQEDRKKVFEEFFKFYDEHANTIANMYSTIISINSRIAKFRGYGSSLEAELKSQNIPIAVYETLIKNVKNHCGELKKFLKFRERELGLEQIHTYDRMRKVYTTDKEYSYEEGVKLCLDAASTASSEYHDLVKHVLQDGWVDVYPGDNKYNGAYSWGSYNSHPYILLDHNNTLDSVYTIMHEAGHSVHSYLSDKNQNPLNASYSIYVAEIASTFAECILTDYLLENETDENVKKTLIEENIMGIIATLYRQTLFAEFEYRTHKLVDSGEVLTSDTLSAIMNELYLEYYDIDLDTEPLKKYVWMYIGHLYFAPFYVYQYATCITASFNIYDKYLESKHEGLEMLYSILKQGGSNYADNILLNAGIDLTKDQTYNGVINYLKSQMDKIQK